ncbi:MAG TPA: hypothetical protein VKY73_04960 [Polyangiaceae bacterium]|nr:hypothetical protein [Polyangiaceae bacterium]
MRIAAFVIAFAVALACSSKDDPPAPGNGSTGGGGSGNASGGASVGTHGGSGNSAGGASDAGGAADGGEAPSTGGDVGSSGDTGSGGDDGSGGTPPGTGLCGAEEGQLFGSDHPWNQRIDDAPLDAESPAIIAYLQSNHTSGARFRIDGPSDDVDSTYGFTVLTADASTPHEEFETTNDFYSPDCDRSPPPVPAGGAIEGESGYACTTDGDCHLIVIDTAECRLYEMWRADRESASSFRGGCQAVWDLRAPYTPILRGDCCTSADAAGLPIAAHLFSADEIAAGEIRHAIRFILPNALIRERVYVRPATHSTPATSGSSDAPPYGARLRLKASFDESSLNPAARVVARALKRYGMILADAGNLTFTAQNDRFTTAKWRDVGLGPNDLTSLEWTDFEVPELGDRYVWDNACSCERTP